MALRESFPVGVDVLWFNLQRALKSDLEDFLALDFRTWIPV
jgi:hypothetical protein